ncbi:MAG: type II toxin-antitoxin system HicB family antitoxin [Candidatus Poribacteria bacterium]|nr:type II toxin-antitoxin system HicB family antitoxin [Candidatus Poribacteria bacterium]
MHKHYPIVIDKDPDSDYGVTVPDLPGCYTIGDTIADVLTQAVEAIELHLEGMLLDGDPIPEPKDIAFHETNPEYADGVWKTITIKFPELRHYPLVIHKDTDSTYGVTIPDLPGCFTAGDTLEDALNQAREAVELHMECLLLDGDPIPEPKTIAYHQDNPDYADGQLETVAVIIPTDAAKIRITQPNPLQRFFQWFNPVKQTIR